MGAYLRSIGMSMRQAKPKLPRADSGWASSDTGRPSKTPKAPRNQHIESGGEQLQDTRLGHEPFSPAVRYDRQMLHQKKTSQCPGGIWTDTDGIVQCIPQMQGRPEGTHYPREAGDHTADLNNVGPGQLDDSRRMDQQRRLKI
jgi:hypothetical protein